MKNGKWIRLGMGLCMLVSLLFLPGTGSSHCWTCSELAGEVGYLEIHNNTIYYIQVTVISGGKAVFYAKITDNPPYTLSVELESGPCLVRVHVLPPIGFGHVLYKDYTAYVPKNWKVQKLTITIPNNFNPFPKNE